MSSRAQLDKAQYKIWPPTAELLEQHKMAAISSGRHKIDSKTSYSIPKLHSSTPRDPSRHVKSTTTGKSNSYYASSSAEYIANPTVSTTSRKSQEQRPSRRQEEPSARKSSKDKAVQDPYLSQYAMPMKPVPTPMTRNIWPPTLDLKSDTSHKHRSKDKDRDKQREKLPTQGYEREISKDKLKDPHRQEQPASGRKLRTDEPTKQSNTSSSRRRHRPEDDLLSPQTLHQSSIEPQGPSALPNQAPSSTAHATMSNVPPQRHNMDRIRSREKRRSYSPPPAPLVAPVWLPDRDKGRSKSHKTQDRTANQQSGPSGSDTDRDQRSIRNEYRTQQRNTSHDSLSKAVPKKESTRMLLTAWFTRKAPKIPVESPVMPTPASVFFSPLPERPAPAPHLVSLSAGEGPSDIPHPYLSHNPSYPDANKTPAASTPSLQLANELNPSSKKHQRSQSVMQNAKGTSSNNTETLTAVRSQTGAASQAVASSTPPSKQYNVPLSRSQAPVVQQNYLVSRSHAHSAQRQQTPAITSSTFPQSTPAPSSSHQLLEVNQLQGEQRHSVEQSSRHHSSDAQLHYGYTGNTSCEFIQYQAVQPRSATTPVIPSPTALSHLVPPRSKHSGEQTSAASQKALPAGKKIVSEVDIRPAIQQQHHSSSTSLIRETTVGDVRSGDANAHSTSKRTETSLYPALELRNVSEMGYLKKQAVGDFYPPGYASVSSITLQTPGNLAVSNSKKGSMQKRSSPVEGSSLLNAPPPKYGNSKYSGDGKGPAPTVPDVSSSSETEGHGISSIIASRGISTLSSSSSPAQHVPSVNPTPRSQTLQVPHTNDQPFHQGVPTNQPSEYRPTPEPSPSGSYMTVPILSAHTSPSHNARAHELIRTPSSSSTIIQPPTPKGKLSQIPPKESALQSQYVDRKAPTTWHLSVQGVQPQELYSGPGVSTRDPLVSHPGSANATEPRSNTKLRSHSHDLGSRDYAVPRSNTDSGYGRSVQPQGNHTSLLDPYGQYTAAASSGYSYDVGSSRAHVTSSSKLEVELGTSGAHNSRSQKRMTGHLSNAGNGQVDPYIPSSRTHQQSQPVSSSNRQRRERDPPRAAVSSTMSPVEASPPLYRPSSNNGHRVSSSNPPAPPSRNIPNSYSTTSLPDNFSPNHSSTALSPSVSRHNHSESVSRSTRPPVSTTGNNRTSSEPPSSSQPARVPVAGHLSTPAPTADYLPPPTPAQEVESLKSPPSVAPTLQKQTSQTPSRPSSTQSSSAESKKKGGFLGLLRSISSVGKQRDSPSLQPEVLHEPKHGKLRRPSTSKHRPEDLEALKSPGSSTTRVIALPPVVQQNNNTPATAVRPQDRKVSPPRGFHPWKLLSNRNRTVSAASVEALDGTGTGTHGTPDGSVRSSATSGMYPPLRDPMLATQEWRNREEMEMLDRGTIRRRRPGVTFEVVEDNISEPRSKPQRASKLR